MIKIKKEIVLSPVKASLKLFKELEKKKLIRLLRPTEKTVKTKTKTGTVSKFYVSSKKFGTHALMCVGKRTLDIRLSYHDDNEDFLLINPSGLKFKKLYLVLSFLKGAQFIKKFLSKKLGKKDLIAVELEFNNPRLSFFTMLKRSVHCEITDASKGQHPVFFVSEPSRLKDNKLTGSLYDIKLDKEKRYHEKTEIRRTRAQRKYFTGCNRRSFYSLSFIHFFICRFVGENYER
ncbi:MAG: hypothetical protein LBU09_01735 [Endomicrobium sp.]|nr:hypothetical protein [Endomicrobium sp.]